MASLNDVLFLFGHDMNHEVLDVIESDQNIQSGFQEATEFVQCGNFTCHTCKKVFKRRGSFAHHKCHANQPKSEEDSFSKETLHELLNHVKAKICGNCCYSAEIRSQLSDYQLLEVNQDLLHKIQNIHFSYCEKVDKEKFYSRFYSQVVCSADRFFPGLGKRSATLLCSKLADQILIFKKKENTPATLVRTPLQLSESEKDGLYYIGGYILHKLHKKLKNSSNWASDASQQSLALLEAGKLNEEEVDEGSLVTALNRGGLWSVKACVYGILVVAETNFRLCTPTGMHRIDTESILNKTITHETVLSNFNTLLIDCDLNIEDELSKCILHNILSLYFRVRAFSFTRDFVQKYKRKQQMSKKKGLRRELKRSSDAPKD